MLSHNLTTTTVTPLHPLESGGVMIMVSYGVTPRNARKGVTLDIYPFWAQYVEGNPSPYTEQRHEVPATKGWIQ